MDIPSTSQVADMQSDVEDRPDFLRALSDKLKQSDFSSDDAARYFFLALESLPSNQPRVEPGRCIDSPNLHELLLIILLVTQSEECRRPDYFDIAFPAIFRPALALANRPSLDYQAMFALVGWAALGARQAPGSPDTLSLVDSAYPHITRARTSQPDMHADYLLCRARVYAVQSHQNQGPSIIAAIAAIEEARACISDTDASSVESLCQAFSIVLPNSSSQVLDYIYLLYPFVQWATPLLPIDSPSRLHLLAGKEVVTHEYIHTLSLFITAGDLPDRLIHDIFDCAMNLVPPVMLDAQDLSFIRDQVSQTRSGIVSVPPVQVSEYPAGAVQLMIRITADLIAQIEHPLQGNRRLFHSSFFGALIARAMGVPTAMHLYRHFMANLHGDIYRMVTLPMRYEVYHRVFGIIPDAISYATELGQYELALEWSDRGRAIIWGQLLHLRFPYLVELRDADPALAERWTDATTQMYAADITPFRRESLHVLTASTTKLKNVMADIEKLDNPKFNIFFANKTIEDIRSSAVVLGGPIIFLNVNRYCSSALAVVPMRDHIIHIPLSSIDYKVLTTMQVLFSRYIEHGGRGDGLTLERIGKLVKSHGPQALPPHSVVSFPEVLKYLWAHIMKPVLDALKVEPMSPESSDQLPRIWWSPSGPLSSLPIHAAGDYGEDEIGNKLSDYIVSSYFSSTSIISYASRPAEESQGLRLLAVANPDGCGLPGTEGDLEAIKAYVSNPQLTVLSKTKATVEAVKRDLEHATWVHFACHAKQDKDSPLDSAFILANHARLSMADIAKLSLPHAEFAFLSACQTAQGTGGSFEGNPNESEHLAAGMLVAGYRSVVGSMWNVSDECAPKVARQLYKRLFENGKPDYKQAAYALHDAAQALRKEGVSFGIWVPFIHLGV